MLSPRVGGRLPKENSLAQSSPRKGILTLEPGMGVDLKTPDGIPKTTATIRLLLGA